MTTSWTRVEAGYYTTPGWVIRKNPTQSVNEFAWLLYTEDAEPYASPYECFDTLAEAKAYAATVEVPTAEEARQEEADFRVYLAERKEQDRIRLEAQREHNRRLQAERIKS